MRFDDVLGLIAGLGLFLFGMKILSDGLEQAAGARLRKMLEKLTSRRTVGLLVGLLVTGIIQSSSATTVMVVGFVNAGLMSLSQSVGVIMGANIGTTVTSWLVALNPKQVAPFLMLLGAAATIFVQKRSVRHAGMIFAGLGLLFVGLNTMSDALAPLQDSAVFRDMMVSLGENPFLGILAGLVITAIIQSSSASVAILQALAMQGLVPIQSAIYILFGQNIGTCATALLASVGTSKTARRAAVIHLLFNVLGTVVFVTVILVATAFGYPLLAPFVQRVAPGNVSVQIALSHLVFNIVTTAVLFPFGDWLVKLAHVLVPGQDKKTDAKALLHINELSLQTPSFAISEVIREIDRMMSTAKRNIEDAFAAFLNGDESLIRGVGEREELIDFLNSSITAFLVKLNSRDHEKHDAKLIASLYHVLTDVERIGDHAENIADEAQVCIEQNLTLHEGARQELEAIYANALRVFDMAVQIFNGNAPDGTLEQLFAAEEAVDEGMRTFLDKNLAWQEDNEYSAMQGLMMVKIVTNLERVADHCTNIAKGHSA